MRSIFSACRVLGAVSAALIASCHTTATATPSPAVLVSADTESMEMVKTTLAKAMNKNSVKLGAGDLTQSPTISVLPPRSYAPAGAPQNQAGNFTLPTAFTLMMDGAECYFVKDGTDIKFLLNGVKCKPAATL